MFTDINEERLRLLDAVLDGSANKAPALEDVIHALAFPVVRRAVDGDDLEAAGVLLVAHNLREAQNARNLMEKADRSLERLISAMAEACPTLSREDVIWVFSFCVGVCYSWQVTFHRYDTMLGSSAKRKGDQVINDIVSFSVAGVESIIKMRTS